MFAPFSSAAVWTASPVGIGQSHSLSARSDLVGISMFGKFAPGASRGTLLRNNGGWFYAIVEQKV